MDEASICDVSVKFDITEPDDFLDSRVFSDDDHVLYTMGEEAEHSLLS